MGNKNEEKTEIELLVSINSRLLSIIIMLFVIIAEYTIFNIIEVLK